MILEFCMNSQDTKIKLLQKNRLQILYHVKIRVPVHLFEIYKYGLSIIQDIWAQEDCLMTTKSRETVQEVPRAT